MLDLVRCLMKGYIVYRSQENSRRLILDLPTNLFRKVTWFFWLQGLGRLGYRCTKSFSRATNAALAGVAKLCDSQTLIESCDCGKYMPICIYSCGFQSLLPLYYLEVSEMQQCPLNSYEFLVPLEKLGYYSSISYTMYYEITSPLIQ